MVAEDPEGISERENGPELNVIGMCYSVRKVGKEEETYNVRYFLGHPLAQRSPSSRGAGPQQPPVRRAVKECREKEDLLHDFP